MTKHDPIDQASTDASLELNHNSMERVKAVKTKDAAKVTLSAGSIMHMLIASRFRQSVSYSQSSMVSFQLKI